MDSAAKRDGRLNPGGIENLLGSRLKPVVDFRSLLEADIVIEAVPEEFSLKESTFKELDNVCPPQVILSSNTSSLSITRIAAATKHPERVIGMHFFNPAHKMQLVEVIPGLRTSPVTVKRTLDFGRQLGKFAIAVSECPSFLVNRLLSRYMNEALWCLQEGAAAIEQIDAAAMDVAMPVGPLALRDANGADVGLSIAKYNYDEYGERFAYPELLQLMVGNGLLGRKSGMGFYLYKDGKRTVPNPRIEQLMSIRLEQDALKRHAPDEYLPQMRHDAAEQSGNIVLPFSAQRLFLPMINEAFLVLQEKIVEPDLLDPALEHGLRMRLGPLAIAQRMGLPACLAAMEEHFKVYGERFRPAPLLRRLVWGRFDKVVQSGLLIMSLLITPLVIPVSAVADTSHTTLRRLKPILDTSTTPSDTGSNSGSSPSYVPNSSSNNDSSYTLSPSTSTEYGAQSSAHSSKVDELMSKALQAHADGKSAYSEKLFNQVLALDPKDTDAYYNLGVIAEERGDYNAALQIYQKGLHVSPEDQELKTAYATAAQKIQQAESAKQQAAIAAADQIKAAQQTEQLKYLGAQAASAFHAGKYDLAIKNLQTIAAQRPDDPDVQYALAQAYRQKKDYRQAIDHIQKAVAIVPSNQQYRQLLTNIIAEKNGGTGFSPVVAQGAMQGIPPLAPSYSQGSSSDLYSSSQSSVGNQSVAPQGQITPFTPDATEAPPGSSSGFWGRGGSTGGGYYNSGSGTMSYRARRMLTGALIGATAGGLMGSLFHPYYGYGYGRGGGMMRGALWGGMAGLIFGGL